MGENMTEDYYAFCEETGERGCCLLCDEAEDGCLCYDCKCTKCEHYDEEEKCTIARRAEENSSDNLNLLISIAPQRWITIKFDGPIIKESYAKIKPFIQYNFHWDKDHKEYWRDYDSKFAQELIDKLELNGFRNWHYEKPISS